MKYLYRLLLIVSGLILTQAVGIEKPGRQMEDLDRGIVAIRSNPEEVFISWRLLGTDPEKTGFNLYRGSLKLNNKLLTQSTNFIDKTTTNDVYSVKAVIRSKELKESDTCYVRSQNYFRIPLNRPLPGTVKGEVV
ncbi:MAG: yesW, partial [Bacteroidetes bacterium]|nr:yesW [Bacteroidota bacterium]